MATGKTSTFTIHHDHCDPGKWTCHDILAFADFVRFGSMEHAARLSTLGVQLVLSEHHVAKGGTIEEVGWCDPGALFGEISDLEDAAQDDITELCRVYRGPVEYVARLTVGDEDGEYAGTQYEIKATLAEAQALFENEPSADSAAQ